MSYHMHSYLQVPYSRYRRCNEAVPDIFEDLQEDITPPSPSVPKQTKRRRRVVKRQLQKEEVFDRAEEIVSFADLTSSLQLNLTPFTDIVIRQDEQQVLLYKLHQVFSMTHRPSVCFSLRIFHDLSVSLWINGTKLKDSDLTWLLGHTKGKLSLWS